MNLNCDSLSPPWVRNRCQTLFCSLRPMLMSLYRDQKHFKDLSKQVEELMSIGWISWARGEALNCAEKWKSRAVPIRRIWCFLLFVVKKLWNNVTLHNFCFGWPSIAYRPSNPPSPPPQLSQENKNSGRAGNAPNIIHCSRQVLFPCICMSYVVTCMHLRWIAWRERNSVRKTGLIYPWHNALKNKSVSVNKWRKQVVRVGQTKLSSPMAREVVCGATRFPVWRTRPCPRERDLQRTEG